MHYSFLKAYLYHLLPGKDLPYEASAERNSDEKDYDAGMKPLMFDHTAEVSSPSYVVAEVNGPKSRTNSVGSRASHSSSAPVSRNNTLSVHGEVDVEARAVTSPMVGRVAATPVLTASGTLGLNSCACVPFRDSD